MRLLTLVHAAALSAAAILAAPAVRAGEIEKLPAETQILMRIDAAALLKTDLFKRFLAMTGGNNPVASPEFKKFSEATGFNLDTDLTSATIGIGGNFMGGRPSYWAVVTGKFDAAKIKAFAAESGKAKVEERGGLTVISNSAEDADPDEPSVVLLDGSTLLLGDADHLDAIIASATGTASNVSSSPLLGPIVAMGTPGHLYMAMIVPAAAKEQMKANPMGASFSSVNVMTVAFDLASGLKMVMDAHTDKPENGKMVTDALTGFVAMGRMMAGGQDPEAATLLESVKVEQQGALARLSFALTQEQLDQVIAKVQGMFAGMIPGGFDGGG
ncbi:MAG: hypothetical protein ACT4PV_13705, partial [Planctomycetaceae bacterium]